MLVILVSEPEKGLWMIILRNRKKKKKGNDCYRKRGNGWQGYVWRNHLSFIVDEGQGPYTLWEKEHLQIVFPCTTATSIVGGIVLDSPLHWLKGQGATDDQDLSKTDGGHRFWWSAVSRWTHGQLSGITYSFSSPVSGRLLEKFIGWRWSFHSAMLP